MVENRKLKVADFHCDALSKLQANPGIDFRNDPRLDVTAERLAEGNVGLQVFAIYLSAVRGRAKFEDILGQIECFHQRLLVLEGFSGCAGRKKCRKAA